MTNGVNTIIVLLTCLACFGAANAGTLQTSISAKSSHFLEGTNLSDDSPAIALNADWTFDKGGYLGIDCYASTVDASDGLDSGCDYYAGYFRPLSTSKAFSAQLTQHKYSRGLDHEWDFRDFSATWHTSKKTWFSATYSQNWLNRPFDTYAIKGDTKFSLSERLNLNISGSVMAIESGAPVDKLVFGKASLSYSRDRWSTEAGIIYTDKDQRRMVPFDVDQADFLLTVSYRLY